MGVDLSEFGERTGQRREPEDRSAEATNGPDLSQLGQPVTSQSNREASGGTTPGALVFQFAAGFNDVVGTMVDAPVQGSAQLMQTMGLIDEADVPTFTEIFNKGVPEASTPSERVLRSMGQGTAASATLAAPVFRGAQLSSQVPQGVAQANLLRDALLRGINENPAGVAGAELIATLFGEAGAGIAAEAGGGPVTQTAAGITGAFVPTAALNTPTAFAVRLGGRLFRAISPAARQRRAEEAVSSIMGTSEAPEAVEQAAVTEAVRQQVPGTEFSVAEATGQPSLIAAQRDLEQRATGSELDALVARKKQNIVATQKFGQEAAPAGEDRFVVDLLSRRVDNLRVESEIQEGEVTKRLQELAQEVPRADRAARGESLRTRLRELRTEASDVMTAEADRLGINNNQTQFPWTDFRESLVASFKSKGRFEDVKQRPEVLREIEKIADETISFADLKSLRERVTDDILDAVSSANPSRKKIRSLSVLKAQIDDYFDRAAPIGDDVGLSQRWEQFRNLYKTEFIDRFERSGAFKVRQRKGTGEYRTTDERVAQAFFAPGEVTPARQFKAAFRNDPEANAAYRDIMLDSLNNAAMREGEIKPNLLETWRRRHQSVLDEFPALNEEVSDIEAVVRAGSKRRASLAARRALIEQSQLAKALKGDPEMVVDKALKNPELMRQMVRSLRGTTAAQGLQRTVWTKALRELGPDFMENPERLLVFMDRHDSALREVLPNSHLKNLRTIYEALERTLRTPIPAGQATTADPLRGLTERTGSGPLQIQSRIFAAESGRTSFRFIAGDLFARLMQATSRREADALMKQALFDPDVAKTMAGSVGAKKASPEVRRKIGTFLFNLGFGAEENEPRQ